MVAREQVVNEIIQIASELWPTATVKIFGSQMTKILTPSSDLDVAILNVPEMSGGICDMLYELERVIREKGMKYYFVHFIFISIDINSFLIYFYFYFFAAVYFFHFLYCFFTLSFLFQFSVSLLNMVSYMFYFFSISFYFLLSLRYCILYGSAGQR